MRTDGKVGLALQCCPSLYAPTHTSIHNRPFASRPRCAVCLRAAELFLLGRAGRRANAPKSLINRSRHLVACFEPGRLSTNSAHIHLDIGRLLRPSTFTSSAHFLPLHLALLGLGSVCCRVTSPRYVAHPSLPSLRIDADLGHWSSQVLTSPHKSSQGRLLSTHLQPFRARPIDWTTPLRPVLP
ncbi:hypothetical protein EV356DRAFT_166787 [Viridothelium virens]|uniref:Uncharacterized protein n=1 Tax=Viridothelium virens TaxID=1048519 RepID=A0A6A6HM88_VIRVR|nr:hypothetical protein EV356DRAFT_166787 [Viridothelium virens]